MRLGTPWMRTLVPGAPKLVEVAGNHGFKSEPQHLAAILSELRDQAKQAPAEGASHPAIAAVLKDIGLGAAPPEATKEGAQKPWYKFW